MVQDSEFVNLRWSSSSKWPKSFASAFFFFFFFVLLELPSDTPYEMQGWVLLKCADLAAIVASLLAFLPLSFSLYILQEVQALIVLHTRPHCNAETELVHIMFFFTA